MIEDIFIPNEIICPEDITATKERIKEYQLCYREKYDICKRIKPNIIAEIGVRAGYSAWSFLKASPEAKYFGFDANNGKHGGQGGENGCYFEWAKHILKQFNVELIELNTQETNNLSISNVDLFHIDGDHSYDGVIHDLNISLKTLSKNGYILIDDIDYIPEVGNAVKQWIEINKSKIEFAEYLKTYRGDYLIKIK